MKRFGTILEKHAGDVVLMFVFLYLAMRIYVDAYLHETMMSPDSCGYLREALNLAQGNGFRCDGIAGYGTWFANWPIMYPLTIAAVMLVAKTNVYLASKIAAMLVVGIILVIMRFRYKEKAWIYSLCVLNLGFINLAEYTWSECTFILFLFGFSLILAHIISKEHAGVIWYAGLGVLGTCAFLTRYIGLYVWFVAGIYILYYGFCYIKNRDQQKVRKMAGLIASAGVAGCLGLAYLAMNKKMNGMASGVNRGINPNEDYLQLTKDLADSLLTEIFHVFGINASPLVTNIWFVFKFAIVAVIVYSLIRYVGKRCTWNSEASVICVTGAVYYVVIIVFRYFSSMDTFSYRFFEPATFLICVGLLETIGERKESKKSRENLLKGLLMLILAGGCITMCINGFEQRENSYLANEQKYTEQYSVVPEKSAVIIRDDSEYDYWLMVYRPDTIQGYLNRCTSVEEVYNYFGQSDYVCIPSELSEEILENDEVNEDLKEWIESAGQTGDFVILNLQKE